MKVFKNGNKVLDDGKLVTPAKHIVHIQPGNDYPEVSEWKSKEGNSIMYSIEFKDGVADVDSKLASYMLEKGYASKSRLILPGATA